MPKEFWEAVEARAAGISKANPTVAADHAWYLALDEEFEEFKAAEVAAGGRVATPQPAR